MLKITKTMEITAQNDPDDVFNVDVVEYTTTDNRVAIGIIIDEVEYHLTKSIKGLQPGEVAVNTKEVAGAEYYLTYLGLATKTSKTVEYGGYIYPIYKYNAVKSIAQPIPAPQPVVQKVEEPKKEAKYNYLPVADAIRKGDAWFMTIDGVRHVLRVHTQSDYNTYGFTGSYTLVRMTPKTKEEENKK